MAQTSAYTVRRVNNTTFVIVEDDEYGERPYIYIKLHPHAPLVILNDTGCDAPRKRAVDDDYITLRQLIETVPVSENGDQPLNPGGHRSYLVILSHCHYDHIGGIKQFLERGKNHIIASAAGRDFVESDLPAHSLCKHSKLETPQYEVTHWAQSNERLSWPLSRSLPGDDAALALGGSQVDLDILIIHTPGHTPDSLAWYDVAERTLYVGDSLYQLGAEKEPIIFPPQGDLVEWISSIAKLEAFVQASNSTTAEAEDREWLAVDPDLKLSCSHTTYNSRAKEVLHQARILIDAVVTGQKRPILNQERFGEVYDFYLGDVKDGNMAGAMTLLLPRRLVDDARRWYDLV